MNFKHAFYTVVALMTTLLFCGCGSVQIEDMRMLENVRNEMDSLNLAPILKVKADDIISIQVASSEPALVLAFQQISRDQVAGAQGASALGVQDGYRVDEEGNIYLPYLGQVQVAGKTLLSIRQEINTRLKDFFQDASVQVRFLNFRITLLGEVNLPNVYIIPNERLTILEAIGLAGDFTPYAKRNDVLVMRDRGQGQEFHRLNTQDKSVFTSPYFYLRPNDIVYVEPLKAKQYATQGDFFQRYAGVLVPFVSLVTFFLGTTIK